MTRPFTSTRVWVFDLDNTLYPASCNLFAQVDHKMGAFVAKFLDVPYPYARYLQKAYYRQFGTTLSGMMTVHGMPAGPFLDYVHDIDVSHVPARARAARGDRRVARPQADLHQRHGAPCRERGRKTRHPRRIRGDLRHRRRRLRAEAASRAV